MDCRRGETRLLKIEIVEGAVGAWTGTSSNGHAARVDPKSEADGKPFECEVDNLGLARVNDLAFLSMGFNN